MRHLFITIAFAATTFLTAAANKPKPTYSPSAVASFQSTYANATEVNWTDMGNLYKVSFVANGKWATAFYEEDGSLVGVTRNISSLQLPKALQTSLKRRLNNGWVSDLLEFATEDGETYYVNIETADSKTILKSVRNKKWVVHQRIVKL
jgi:hypothetical protein